MPWYINLAVIVWFVMMGLATRIPFFYSCAAGWGVGYLIYLIIR